MRKTYVLLLILFLASWSYRSWSINAIIQTSQLLDFNSYYNAAKSIISMRPDTLLISKVSIGTPFVLIPFMPFTLLPLKLSEYFISIINIISYLACFYVVWKRNFLKLDWLFWLLLSIFAFSFPLTYSLGMGNPIGFVTFSIYFFIYYKKSKFAKWILLIISALLKIFPIVILFNYVLRENRQKVEFNIKHILLMFLPVILISIFLIPKTSWLSYLNSLMDFKITSVVNLTEKINVDIYNQSLSSAFSRFGLNIPFFSPIYLVIATLLILFVISYYIKMKKLRLAKKESLNFPLLLLSLSTLLHPFPWQYYFAIFIPFLMVKIKEFKLLYIIPFLLISLNGDKFHLQGYPKAFIDSSQFIGTLILFGIILSENRLSNFWQRK